MMGVNGENRLKNLHSLLDKITTTIKKKKMQENNIDPTSVNSKEKWKIPMKIVAFCANRILELDDDKKTV